MEIYISAEISAEILALFAKLRRKLSTPKIISGLCRYIYICKIPDTLIFMKNAELYLYRIFSPPNLISAEIYIEKLEQTLKKLVNAQKKCWQP